MFNKCKKLLRYLTHRYSVRDFSVRLVKENLTILGRGADWLDATESGLLIESSKWRFLLCNGFTFGARRARLQKAVLFTWIAFLSEICNPLERQALRQYMKKKTRIANRLIDKIIQINTGDLFERKILDHHLQRYQQASWLSHKVAKRAEEACSHFVPTKLVFEAQEALSKGMAPLLITAGLSGGYWMRNALGEGIGVFKPFDEEIFAPNNPLPHHRGALGQKKLRSGIRSGESMHREVAAYLFDQMFGLGIVPETTYATFTHRGFFDSKEQVSVKRRKKRKWGSFQGVITGFRPMLDLYVPEAEKISVEEIQLLVILDLILGNTDRNLGNLLVADDGKIAAIDHACILSEVHEDVTVWLWKELKQSQEPFYPLIKEIVLAFPWKKVANQLHRHCMITWEALERMRERVALATASLKAGHDSPAALAEQMTRERLLELQGLNQTLDQKAETLVDLKNQ